MSRNRERQQELQPERVEYARTRLVYRKNRKGRAGNYEPIKTNTDALGVKTTGKNKSGF